MWHPGQNWSSSSIFEALPSLSPQKAFGAASTTHSSPFTATFLPTKAFHEKRSSRKKTVLKTFKNASRENIEKSHQCIEGYPLRNSQLQLEMLHTLADIKLKITLTL